MLGNLWATIKESKPEPQPTSSKLLGHGWKAKAPNRQASVVTFNPFSGCFILKDLKLKKESFANSNYRISMASP